MPEGKAEFLNHSTEILCFFRIHYEFLTFCGNALPVISFEDIDRRLDSLGLGRPWLAEVTKRKLSSIRVALAPNSDPKNRSALLQKALSDAIEAEEKRRADEASAVAKLPPGYSAIFWTDEELDRAERASRLAGAGSLAEFCHDVIQGAAEDLLKAEEEKKAAPNVIAMPKPEEEDRPIFYLENHGGIAAGRQINAVSLEPIPVDREFPAGHYALRVFGSSMDPDIPDGSTIVVRALKDKVPPRKGSIVVYSDESGSTLKVLEYRKPTAEEETNGLGRRPILTSLNPEYPDIEMTQDGRIEAVFVEVL